MNEEKVKKVNSRFFGRQRRVDFIEKIAYVVVGIFSVALIFYLVSKQSENVDHNVNFAYLTTYMQNKGYSCELLFRSGGKCSLRNERYESFFYRYDNGLQLSIKTENYFAKVDHSDGSDKVEFNTYKDAYIGYRNMEYTCTLKDTVISEVDRCVTKNGVVLDNEAYIGVINDLLHEIELIINSSGYEKDALIYDYEWIKK